MNYCADLSQFCGRGDGTNGYVTKLSMAVMSREQEDGKSQRGMRSCPGYGAKGSLAPSNRSEGGWRLASGAGAA